MPATAPTPWKCIATSHWYMFARENDRQRQKEAKMDHVNFPYRSSSHLLLHHVIAESGSWEKHGLDVKYNYFISSADAHADIPAGRLEFVSGNHVSTYGHRARGDQWVYLGQATNVAKLSLVVRPDSEIATISDLREKYVASSSPKNEHPNLNEWLYLKQHGLDVDKDEVAILDRKDHNNKSARDMLFDGDAHAALMTPPNTQIAAAAGLKVIEIDPLPMILNTSISTSISFVRDNPDLVQRFLKGILEGIAFFKTHPEATKKIMKESYTRKGELSNEVVDLVYEDLAQTLEPTLYPSLEAIANVYQLGVRQDPDALKVNPMALWDMHHLREIDDSGFIRRLYE
jgi:ABC-type nitrate/sulfonate/bicarbonate transport system substrate-binding protein